MSGYPNEGHPYGGTTSPYANGNPNAYYSNSNFGYGEEMVEFDVLNHGHGHGDDPAYLNNVNMNVNNNNGYDPNDRSMGRSPPKPIRPGLNPTEDFVSPVRTPLGAPMGAPGWPLPNRRPGYDRPHVDSFASVASTPNGSRSATPAFVRIFPRYCAFAIKSS